MDALAMWSPKRWAVAAMASLVVGLAVGLPSDVIPNPVFGRPIDVTWWSYPVLVVTAVLGGLLVATYISDDQTVGLDDDLDRPGRVGGIGGMLSFFAVGCPTCNKLIVVAIGTTGALNWFAPAQPILAGLSLGLLAWALRTRLSNSGACRIAL